MLHSSSHESLDLASFSVNKKARKDISEMKKLYNEIEKKRDKNDKWEIATREAGTSIVRQFCITRNEIVGHVEDNCVLNTDCIVPKCISCESQVSDTRYTRNESCPREHRGADHFMDGASIGVIKSRQEYL